MKALNDLLPFITSAHQTDAEYVDGLKRSIFNLKIALNERGEDVIYDESSTDDLKDIGYCIIALLARGVSVTINGSKIN